MSGNSFGTIFKVTTWGESHGKGIGVVIDGCPPNLFITEEDINNELNLRKSGSIFSTSRSEPDSVKILSGVFNNLSLGTPISLLVLNKDIKSEYYEPIKNVFRPGHADYTYFKKYGFYDWRGGGRASARETVARVAAGAIAKKIIEKFDIKIIGFTKEILGIEAEKLDFERIHEKPFWFPDDRKIKKIIKKAEDIKKEGDSFGGIVEIIVKNVPTGLGEPVFDKLDARLAYALMSVGAVKGVEIGAGFRVANMKGSENNDQMNINGFLTNNAGGILGGISTGEDIVLRVAIKPIPSISKPQLTINGEGEEVEIEIHGRHDVCAIPRIIPVLISMVRITLADFILLMLSKKYNNIFEEKFD